MLKAKFKDVFNRLYCCYGIPVYKKDDRNLFTNDWTSVEDLLNSGGIYPFNYSSYNSAGNCCQPPKKCGIRLSHRNTNSSGYSNLHI